MKLTIVRLVTFSDQDHIDLGKIWPEYSPSSLPLTRRTAFMPRALTSVCWRRSRDAERYRRGAGFAARA
jgi:hypothetical protein